MKPSEYFRRQCFTVLEPSEPYIDRIIEYIGADKLLFGSDYPHVHWSTNENDQDILDINGVLQEQLPKETIQKILWDNPARFYGLE
jgi:predicted TIM-barrel fold metal-dependent hydrolase